MKVVIVGGVAGGASAAARLRRLQEDAEIIVFERGEYVSFANCGLPYYIGNVITEKSDLTLQTPQSFKDRFNIDVRILQEVVCIDKDEHKVSIRNLQTNEVYEESYDKLVLSPGASAIKPNMKGLDNDYVFTLRNIPDTYKIKEYIEQHNVKKATVIGGGFIGLEMAENLKENGIDVTIVEAAKHVAGVLDEEVAAVVSNYILEQGIHIVTDTIVTDINELQSDLVILSVGVKPESKLAKEAGIDTSEKGTIRVNEHLETSATDIYAIGDAIEIKHFISKEIAYLPLAGPANKQGRIVAGNISGMKRVYESGIGTSIMKIFDMSVAMTGLSEKVLQRLKKTYNKVYLWGNNHASYYPEAKSMLIKVLFAPNDGTILGAQIVGYEGVDKRIDVFATAIHGKMKAQDLCELELAYAPPYSSAKDPVNMIGFMIDNLMNDKVNQHHYDMYSSLENDGATILDVRTSTEYEDGAIPNSIHIPVDELRKRIHELDKKKPIYVNCQSGLRSYIACRMLSQAGYNCSNLAGGYRLYDEVYNHKESITKETYPCGIEKE